MANKHKTKLSHRHVRKVTKSEAKIKKAHNALKRIEKLIKELKKHQKVNKKEIEKHLTKVKTADVIKSAKKPTSLNELEQRAQEVYRQLKTMKTGAAPKKEIKKIKEIAVELKKHRIVTDFDRVIFYVSKNKKTTVNKVVKDLLIDKKRVEECAAVLEEAELIEIEYPLIGSLILKVKGFKPKTKQKKTN